MAMANGNNSYILGYKHHWNLYSLVRYPPISLELHPQVLSIIVHIPIVKYIPIIWLHSSCYMGQLPTRISINHEKNNYISNNNHNH